MMSDGDLTPGANSPRPTLVASVFWTVFRLLWAATAFCSRIALVVLYVLGAWWVGSELRAAAPRDPVLHHGGAPSFGVVLFATSAHRASADHRHRDRRGPARQVLDLLHARRRRF